MLIFYNIKKKFTFYSLNLVVTNSGPVDVCVDVRVVKSCD